MSREIKFRAISLCKGEHWLYGDIRHYAHNPHTEKWTIHDPATDIETDIDETTIGQFSGLYDKNDKEIYEGDIVKTRLSKNFFGIVTWHTDGYFFFDTSNGEWKRWSDGYRPAGEMLRLRCDGTCIDFEVIGNIYDNPELLKN